MPYEKIKICPKPMFQICVGSHGSGNNKEILSARNGPDLAKIPVRLSASISSSRTSTGFSSVSHPSFQSSSSSSSPHSFASLHGNSSAFLASNSSPHHSKIARSASACEAVVVTAAESL